MKAQISLRLKTGQLVHVIFPGDGEFASAEDMRNGMIEAAVELRRLADNVLVQASRVKS